ncbi:MAG: DsbA family oxidoreductase [Bacteroidota bacterium]
MKQQVTIDIISDIICPWCYIGKSRLSRAIEEVQNEFNITTRLRPFQLYPKIPKGGLPKSSFPATKKPGLGSALKAAAAEENLVMDYKNIHVIPNTLEAHRLMYLCEPNNDLKNALGLALFESYFEKAEDVEDPLVLARIARDTGMSKDKIDQFLMSDHGQLEVEAEIQELKADGIAAVPSFIINEDILVMGVQPMEKWLRFFQRLRQKALK